VSRKWSWAGRLRWSSRTTNLLDPRRTDSSSTQRKLLAEETDLADDITWRRP
jgi:hypothetical protein